MNSEEIAGRIKESIQELVTEYNENPWSLITESDVTNRLYSILQRRPVLKGISIHSELRPFQSKLQGKASLPFVIKDRKDPHWVRQRKANDGAMIDLVLVDSDKRFENEAHKKAVLEQGKREIEKLIRKGLEPVEDSLELRYWRMLSYPVKAFKAAIEAKIRVSGNMPKIRNDVKKLKKIKEENDECGLYLVVLDCKADDRKLREIRAFADEYKVVPFISQGRSARPI